jgi:radical SAM protein with 4Fe4S-binding SPASM domain
MQPLEYALPFPRVVRVEPAAACNLKCSHCPTGTVDMKRGIMSEETFALILKALDAHREAVKVVVLYHGGEPLLHKRFAHMVRSVKCLGVPYVKTVSNGMLLTERLFPDLVSSGLNDLEVSLDGESPAENDRVRRNCSFTEAAANIRRFIEFKKAVGTDRPRILLSTTQFLTAETVDQRDEAPPPPRYLLDYFAAELAAGSIVSFKTCWAMHWPHMEVLQDVFDVYEEPENPHRTNYCDLVHNTMTVRANGDVVACCYDLTSRFVLGNVHETDLAAIWNNHKSRGLRRSLDQKKFIPLCAGCNLVARRRYLLLKQRYPYQGLGLPVVQCDAS